MTDDGQHEPVNHAGDTAEVGALNEHWKPGPDELGDPVVKQVPDYSTDAEHEHCWHTTGYGSTWWTGGTEEERCCWCRAERTRKYEIEGQQVEGHGPHYKESVRVYDDEKQESEG